MESDTFVGLDVHKNLVVATAVDGSGRTLSQAKLGPSDRELVEYLEGLPGSKRVALEACSVWEHYHDAAVAAGAQVVLSHPFRTRLIADASLKSDKVDSEALATLLRLNALPTAFVPNAETRALRRLVRERVFYRKENKAVANHTYAQLFGRGIGYEEGILMRPRRRGALRELGIPEVDRGLDRLDDLSAATKELDAAVHTAFLASREAQLLETIPGIGELTAVILVAFLCPIERFRSIDQLSSYCGLCPTNHQSADRSHQGSLKADCNHLLRWVLVEAGWSHRRESRSSYIARVGRRNGRRKGVKRGAVDTAHALLRVVYAILKRGTPYLPHAPERPSCSASTARSPRPSHD